MCVNQEVDGNGEGVKIRQEDVAFGECVGGG